MSASRRTPWLFLLALPLWLAMVVPGAAQTLTADINGDGISDRIEGGGPGGGVLVQLSGHGPAQRLRAAGTILDLALADIDQDGDSDLVATAAGHRHIRLLVWTNAGGGHLLSRLPVRVPSGATLGRARVRVPVDIPVLDDLSDGPDSVVTLPSLHGGHDAITGEPLPAATDSVPTRPHTFRRAPRGPPAVRLLS
jgi:hypothetical protein